ncbi:glutamine--fructose-6-phosphate transaminase (isomerizing) [Pseudactinotalea sp. HY160]|uniref:glutamine--fructose-6-phosphate transaminase (isomerizing) n=1 Tax=Pseudactinotalea sp. HY160 TaxID=2654490 RepID=UPI00128B273D|nr:glutamine--fructose-6-phosphate transaminase (isomerizing) [Pseudactinotalea sp. HY160]MPV51268.1 glutamine--fructose-6-phosphate transaminase (isomerizing) [Pseudactinotalea sp. HY160]
MCGIVGYIGHRPAQPILTSGLKRLEYRGYDSAGIATIDDDARVTLVRAVGKVAELEHAVATRVTADTVGIGHTRWATHGVPSERNSHPHHVGRVYLIHNGIIENYAELADVLTERGYTFAGETDSEVLAALVDALLPLHGTLLEAVSGALKMVVGTYGLALLSDENPDEIVVARRGSPLIVGLGEQETFVASDAAAIVGHTDRVVYLQDGEIGVCTRGGIALYDVDVQPLEPAVEKLQVDLASIQKKGYDHFLLKEIHEQPEALRATLRGRIDPETNRVQLGGLNLTDDQLRSIRNVIVVGCGTAYYAGLEAAYLIEQFTDDVTIRAEVASELRYRSFHTPKNTVALIVSQSGETADTLACLQELQRRGVHCIGIVNVVGSTIAREVDGGIYTHVGAEISVASTKAFTSQVAAVTLFGIALAQAKGMSRQDLVRYTDEFALLPEAIEAALASVEEQVRDVVRTYSDYSHALYVGRDTLYPIALEGALKLKEVTYVHAEGYAAGELKHGPIALIDDSFFEVCYLQDNWLREKSVSALVEMNARGAHAIVVTNVDRELPAETVIRVPTTADLLAPLVFNVVSQLFAYYMAVERGTDVDQPRNLAKSVTVE